MSIRQVLPGKPTYLEFPTSDLTVSSHLGWVTLLLILACQLSSDIYTRVGLPYSSFLLVNYPMINTPGLGFLSVSLVNYPVEDIPLGFMSLSLVNYAFKNFRVGFSFSLSRELSYETHLS